MLPARKDSTHECPASDRFHRLPRLSIHTTETLFLDLKDLAVINHLCDSVPLLLCSKIFLFGVNVFLRPQAIAHSRV